MSKHKFIIGDVIAALKTLPEKSVHVCVTSPPYYNLRSYMKGTNKDELGREKSPQEYVQKLVSVYREVKRVLRDDGIVLLNLGDSYATGKGSCFNPGGNEKSLHKMTKEAGQMPLNRGNISDLKKQGLKQKDLIGIPWRVAFALQEDGWYLRNDNIWYKKNTMPFPATDRFVNSHEHIFLFSKSHRYYFDWFAVSEPVKVTTIQRATRGRGSPTNKYLIAEDFGQNKQGIHSNITPHSKEKIPARFGIKDDEFGGIAFGGKKYPDEIGGIYSGCGYELKSRRRKRDVWHFATASCREAHYACVDNETDCLTIHGWLPQNKLKKGMLAAQFDIKNNVLSWAKIEDIVKYEVVNEEMISASCRDAEFLLTPNHRTLISKTHPKTRKRQPLEIIPAINLKSSHAVPVSANWSNYKNSDVPFSTEWAELIGWYITEGYECKRTQSIEIYQSLSANKEKVDRIRKLLITIGAEFREAQATREYRGKPSINVAFKIDGFTAIFLRQWAPDKKFHPTVLSWSEELLERLFLSLIDGDGHRRPDGRFSFIQKDKEITDMVQAIGFRLGYSAIRAKHKSHGTYTVYFTKKRLMSFRGSNGSGKDYTGTTYRITKKRYTGIVWCPKLPQGTWVARRDGRAFITGNTFPKDIPEIAINAGTSEHGCCPECGAAYIRKLNKTQKLPPTDPIIRNGVELTPEDSSKILWIEENGGEYRIIKKDSKKGVVNTEQPIQGGRTQHILRKGYSLFCFNLPEEYNLETDEEWKAACGADANGEYHGEALKDYGGHGCQDPSDLKRRILEGMKQIKTIGWVPSCKCKQKDPVPCTVLDIFMGSGTTAEVARDMNRNSIGIDLDPNNIPIQKKRMGFVDGQNRLVEDCEWVILN